MPLFQALFVHAQLAPLWAAHGGMRLALMVEPATRIGLNRPPPSSLLLVPVEPVVHSSFPI